MPKSHSRHKTLGLILAGLMTLALLLIFLFPMFTNYPGKYELTSYRGWVLTDFRSNYPLGVITYLLPFAGIAYLTRVSQKRGWGTV